ncbi:MAG: DUF4143 domain-containing protein [Methanomassiliicoccaceae archaeon]|nr:DUF4143 domain-containing protein [Methanomassiliicoccaceae archaeon]
MAGKYIDRIIDKEMSEHLEFMGAVLIEGPKWCGKTRTSKEFAKGILSITNKNQIDYLNLLMENGVFDFLDEEPPMLIDEWQLAPGIWDAVKHVVDDRGKRGQFILTGSSVPPKGHEPLHSGAGRIARLTMRTMSLFESGESNGKVSLRGLFDPEYKAGGQSRLSVNDLAAAIARGGWPESLNDKKENATRIVNQYLKAIINSDVSRASEDHIDPETVKRIIESVARNISTYAAMETIREDAAGESKTLSINTLKKYLDAMRRIFLIEELPAWNPHLRSKTRLITSSKWHFTDPSIALSALRASSDALLKDYRTFGLFFESLCVRDLRIYLQPIEGTVSHFRDVNGNEVDLIVELPGKEWGAVEVKLGGKDIEEGAENLIRLKNNIDTEKMRPPSFLMVLTGGQYAMKRQDGVYIVPIGCLRE